MGIIRKTMSVTTLGAVDFLSDKERTARSARLTKEAARKAAKEAKRLRKLEEERRRQQ